jgi:hypothetical protein
MVDLKGETTEIIIGVNLMVLSFLLSLLMTIRSIEPSFILAFASYALSLAGLVMGFHGLYGLILIRRSKESGEKP